MMVTCTDLIVADQSRSAQGRVHFIKSVYARHSLQACPTRRLPMIYAYMRVSTAHQTLENQHYELLKFADQRSLRVES
jgi:hypothetical protein